MRRKVRREREKGAGLEREWREEEADEGRRVGGWWVGVAGEGASRSQRAPVRRRARVEVVATMETCVAAELEGGAASGGG